MSDQEHHLRTLIQTLERDNADLRAKLARLNGLTNWVCSCGGTDCKGQEENAALRNEVDEQARLNGKGAERELALRTKVETLERGNAALRLVATMAKAYFDDKKGGGGIEDSIWRVARKALKEVES